mgnify:CR=1 FL=1
MEIGKSLCEEDQIDYAKEMIGTIQPVLFEVCAGDAAEGYTDFNTIREKVERTFDEELIA